jgi:hypothetical protein
VELDDEPLVYIWADGIHSGLRGEDDKLCALVIVGVTARGKKRFLAIEDGVREPTQSTLSHMQSMCCRSTGREALLSLKSRGMTTPKLAIGPSHRYCVSTAGQWTVPWGSGPPWMKSTPRPDSNGAGIAQLSS